MGGQGPEGCAQGSSRSCWGQLKSSLGSPPGLHVGEFPVDGDAGEAP